MESCGVTACSAASTQMYSPATLGISSVSIKSTIFPSASVMSGNAARWIRTSMLAMAVATACLSQMSPGMNSEHMSSMPLGDR